MKNLLSVVSYIMLLFVLPVSSEPPLAGKFIANRHQFASLDRHAINTPKRYEKDLPTLVRYLIRPAVNDLQKTRVLWRWITSHIAYDVQGYPLKNRPMVGTAKEAFRQRIAVCGGYSKLFKAMADLARLEAVYITGDVKWGPGKFGGIKHAWNGVKIRGRWYLLDTTWGAGTILDFNNEEKIRYVFRYNEFWFLTRPTHMIFTHFPQKYSWQLLKKPVSPSDFGYFPWVLDPFLKNGLWFNSKPEGNFALAENESIIFTGPADVRVKAVAYQNGKRYRARIKRSGKKIIITPELSRHGMHDFRILVKGPGDSNFQVGAAYQLFRKAKREPVKVRTWNKWHTVKVMYPKYRRIPAGKSLIFRFSSACSKNAEITTGGKTYRVKGSGYFNTQVPVKKGKVTVKVYITCGPKTTRGLKTIMVYEAE